MARDAGLEELIEDDLRDVPGITTKAMFGGWAYLLGGNLLLGARAGSLLVRLGKGNDAWALKLPAVERMVMNGRPLEGWVRAYPDAYGNDRQRRKLIAKAVEFVRTQQAPVRRAKKKTAPKAPATVEAYLAALSPAMRKALSDVRAIVRKFAPDVVESIGYGMPAFKLHGKPLIYIGAAKEHCALYGVPNLPELEKYDISGKGTLRFTPANPLPAAVIRKVLEHRLAKIVPSSPGRTRRH